MNKGISCELVATHENLVIRLLLSVTIIHALWEEGTARLSRGSIYCASGMPSRPLTTYWLPVKRWSRCDNATLKLQLFYRKFFFVAVTLDTHHCQDLVEWYANLIGSFGTLNSKYIWLGLTRFTCFFAWYDLSNIKNMIKALLYNVGQELGLTFSIQSVSETSLV